MNYQRADGTYQCPIHLVPLEGPVDGLRECPKCEFAIDFGPEPPPLEPGDPGYGGPCGTLGPEDNDCPDTWP